MPIVEWNGLWLPKGETHLQRWITRTGYHKKSGYLTYQIKKYRAALKYVKDRRVAVDIGGFIGQWSRVMAMDFETVHAFEPVGLHRTCFEKNTGDFDNIRLHPKALGAGTGQLVMCRDDEHSFGSTRVANFEDDNLVTDNVPVERLDTFDLTGVGLIKIDCEGFEWFVLQGARETLLDCEPVVIVEQKPGHGRRYGLMERQAVAYLRDLGATLRDEISGDFILSWD